MADSFGLMVSWRNPRRGPKASTGANAEAPEVTSTRPPAKSSVPSSAIQPPGPTPPQARILVVFRSVRTRSMRRSGHGRAFH